MRGPSRTVNFDSGDVPSSLLSGTPHHGFYVFVGATAGDGLIMSIPPESDAPDPFRLAPNPRAFAIHLDGDPPSDERFDVEFFSMPIEPNSPAREG